MDLPMKIAVGLAFSGLATRVLRGLFGAVGVAF